MAGQIEVLPSASRAVDTYVASVRVPDHYQGLAVYVDITVHNGGTLVVHIYDVDPVSNQKTELLASASLSGSNQAKRLVVHPALTVSANLVAKDAVSDNVRIEAVVTTAAVTFSLGARPLR